MISFKHLEGFMNFPTRTMQMVPLLEKKQEWTLYQWFFHHFRQSCPPPYPSGAVFYFWLVQFEDLWKCYFPSDMTMDLYPSFLFSFMIHDGLFPFLDGDDCEELMNRIFQKSALSISECKYSFYLDFELKPFEKILTDIDSKTNQTLFHNYCQFLRYYHHVTCLTPSKIDQLKECLEFIRRLKYRLCEGLKDYPWIRKPLQLYQATVQCTPTPFLELCQPWIDSSIRKSRDDWLKKPTFSIQLSTRIASILWKQIDPETQSSIVSYFQQYLSLLLKTKLECSEYNYETWSHSLCKTFPWDTLTLMEINQRWFHIIGRLEYFSTIHTCFQWKWKHYLFQENNIWECPSSFLFPEWVNWGHDLQLEIQHTWKQAESIFFTRWFHEILSTTTSYPFKEFQLPHYIQTQKEWLKHRNFPLRVGSVLDVVWNDTVYNLFEIQEDPDIIKQLSNYFILENRYGKKGWQKIPCYWDSKESKSIRQIRNGLREFYASTLVLEDEMVEIVNEKELSEKEEEEEEDGNHHWEIDSFSDHSLDSNEIMG